MFILQGFLFADQSSIKEFNRQRLKFFRSNHKYYNQFVELHEGMELSGIKFKDFLFSIGNQSWYCNKIAFWIFSIILLSWPLRILLDYNTGYVNCNVSI